MIRLLTSETQRRLPVVSRDRVLALVPARSRFVHFMFTTYRRREFVFTQRSLDVSFQFTAIGDAALPRPLSVHAAFTGGRDRGRNGENRGCYPELCPAKLKLDPKTEPEWNIKDVTHFSLLFAETLD